MAETAGVVVNRGVAPDAPVGDVPCCGRGVAPDAPVGDVSAKLMSDEAPSGVKGPCSVGLRCMLRG